jgi:hypothetical protein
VWVWVWVCVWVCVCVGVGANVCLCVCVMQARWNIWLDQCVAALNLLVVIAQSLLLHASVTWCYILTKKLLLTHTLTHTHIHTTSAPASSGRCGFGTSWDASSAPAFGAPPASSEREYKGDAVDDQGNIWQRAVPVAHPLLESSQLQLHARRYLSSIFSNLLRTVNAVQGHLYSFFYHERRWMSF